MYSPDGKRIVTASGDGTARIWDAASGEELRQLTGHTDRSYAVTYSPDGKQIVTASGDGTAHIWNAAILKERYSHSPATWATSKSAAYRPDGKSDRHRQLGQHGWHLGCGDSEELRQLTGHTGTVWSAAYHPDGKRIW